MVVPFRAKTRFVPLFLYLLGMERRAMTVGARRSTVGLLGALCEVVFLPH